MPDPMRIQLRRTKGWRTPQNTVRVCRPGPYGNPWRIGCTDPRTGQPMDAQRAVQRFCEALTAGELRVTVAEVRRDLRGCNLGCWCQLCARHVHGKPFTITCTNCAPCHSDILGGVANA